MMRTLRFVLGDQLSENISSLQGHDDAQDVLFMCEVMEEATYVRHHPKKIAFLFSAMRHFAQAQRDVGRRVDYVTLDDAHNTGSFTRELQRAVTRWQPQRVVVTFSGEHRVQRMMQGWEALLGVPVEIMPDTRFMCSIEAFAQWAQGRKQLRMEYFYREMRKQYQVLMAHGAPVGGQWNYDAENRQPPKLHMAIPAPTMFEPDDVTRDVLAMVAHHFSAHFGDVLPFHFAVTRAQALQVLEEFIQQRLRYFGDYQDAMLRDEPWMYHAHISFYLNCGLLEPLECVRAAEDAYYRDNLPLNAVEGFIRQVMGWREYVRGLYWLYMPEYAAMNALGASRSLPDFFWTGHTSMHCMQQCIEQTKQHAYAHHIQRLMVLGNFTLLAGIHPDEVNAWYLMVYADAFEWVELPNVTGMILHADGGMMASKPYAASGQYIDRMSDYCKQCRYDVGKRTGANACPFNYLYWHFMQQHRERLSANPRMQMMYRTLDRMQEQTKQQMMAEAQQFLDTHCPERSEPIE